MSVGSASTATASSSTKTDPKKQGFNGLTADDFFKLLIAQLQSQDPTEPVSNEQLLNQLSTMRGLQSNIEMSTTLKDLATSIKATQDATKTPFADSVGQKLSVGNSFIGQQVTFSDSTTGIVTSAHMKDGAVMLVANGKEVALDKLVSVNSARALTQKLVEGDGTDTDGNTKHLVGKGAGVVERDGQSFIQVTHTDSSGKDAVIGEIPFEKIAKVHSYDSVIGKYVEATTSSGKTIFGVASQPAAGVGDKSKVLVNKDVVPLASIVDFPKQASATN